MTFLVPPTSIKQKKLHLNLFIHFLIGSREKNI